MAYKFQIGASTLSGSVTLKESATLQSGFSNNDANITNVGDIAVDSISADNNDIAIDLSDNREAALEIREDTNVYMAFDSQNGAEKIDVKQNMLADTSKEIRFRAAEQAIFSNAANTLNLKASASMNFELNGASTIDLTSQGIELLKPVQMSGSNKIAYGENMTAGNLLVSDGNEFASVAVSGDASLASNGALTIANDAVSNAKLANIARGSIKVGGAGNAPTDLDAKTSGRILVGDGTDLASVAVSGDATLSAAGAITLAAAQTNVTSLLATDIKIGEDDQTKIDFEDENKINFYVNNVKDVVLEENVFGPGADSEVDLGKTGTRWKDLYVDSATVTNNVTIGGNLTVEGTTTTIDSTTINISSSFTFEGPADDHETTLSVGTPIQDIDIVMPEYSSSAGSHQVKMAVLASGESAADYLAASLVTPAEMAVLDGNSTLNTSITIDDNADGFVFNDGGTMKQIRADQVKNYIGTPSLTVTSGSDSSTLAVGMNYFNNHNGAISATCPASSGLSAGDIIRIKAGPDCSTTNKLTINRAGSQTFDATLTSLELESPNAAISLIYVATDDFRIM